MRRGGSLLIVALAWHESDHLGACFESVEPLKRLTGARTLILLDAERDRLTEQIARKVADRVEVARFVSFSTQRNHALDLADTEWVFFIDADERCTRRVAGEISQVLTDARCSAYRVPRRNILFGHEVRHTGWWPDYQIRLLRREKCHYDEGKRVHEVPSVNGPVGTLSSPLIHYNYKTWRQFVEKQYAYATLDAKTLYQTGNRARLRSFVGQPARELKRRLVDYRGYKDGVLGVALSVAMALYRAETQRQLFLLQGKGDNKG